MPPTDEEEKKKTPHIKLLTHQKLGDDVLGDHTKLYHDKVRLDINCGTKVWGISATLDGTDRMGKEVMNLVILYKDGTTAFLKLHDSSEWTEAKGQVLTLLRRLFKNTSSSPASCECGVLRMVLTCC